MDILDGVHQGWVYFHRNLSTGDVVNRGKPSGPRFLPLQAINIPGPSSRSGGTLEPIPGSPEWRVTTSSENGGSGVYLPYEAVVSAVDWNEDGDVDLLARASYGYL